MQLVKMFLAIALLTLTSASSAHAGSKILASAPAQLNAFGNTMFCDITNFNPVAPENVTVTTEIMDTTGTVVAGPQTQTLLPLTGSFLGSADPTAAWCRFTIDGSTKNVRAMAVYDNGTSYSMSLPAY